MTIPADNFSALLRGSTDGDAEAFARLYSVYSGWLLDFVESFFEIDDNADVQDLSLESWLQAWAHIREFPPFFPLDEKHFLWWLKRIAAEQVSKYIEQETQRLQVEARVSRLDIERGKIQVGPITGALHFAEQWAKVAIFVGDLSPTTSAPDQAQFTVFHPIHVQVNTSYKLLVYAHAMWALERVQQDSEARLGFVVSITGQELNSLRISITPGAKIRIVPELSGFIVTPNESVFRWDGHWRCAEFELLATAPTKIPNMLERVGQISVYLGPVLIAEPAINIAVAREFPRPELALVRTRISGSPHQSIFASYAHADSEVVDHLEEAYLGLGLKYLRDIHVLRSGEQWRSRLRELIQKADIFQLFWSAKAKNSRNVKEEWKEALRLNWPHFIRPVYWKKPMPAPPRELKNLHFRFIDLRTKGKP